MVDCILANDAAGARAFLSGEVTEEQFASDFATMQALLAGVEHYTLEQLGTESSDGWFSVSFLMTATMQTGEEVEFAITASEKAGVAGTTYYMQRNAATPVGALTNMKDANAWQWVLLILGGLSLLLTVAAAIDCGLHAKRSKGMMLFLILFGMVSLSFTTAPVFAFSIEHGYYFPYSAFLQYETGDAVLKLFLPLGAVGYFILRRYFVHPDEAK